MSISISGKQTKVGKSLSFYVDENIRKSLKKYFEKFISIDVLFSKQSFIKVGSNFPLFEEIVINLIPELKNSGAPHSLVKIWASL